jgi:hypothetical protein
MKLFLSGPMSSVESWNWPAFRKLAADLKALGYKVFDPSTNGDGYSRPELLKKDIIALAECDGIVLLPDWDYSSGSCLELVNAREWLLPIYQFVDGELSLHEEAQKSPCARLVVRSRETKLAEIRGDEAIISLNTEHDAQCLVERAARGEPTNA